MNKLENSIHDNANGLDYTLVNDHYLPNLTAAAPAEQHPIGRWGRLHKKYLQEHHPIRYNQLFLSGELSGYLAKLDKQAEEQLVLTVRQMQKAEDEGAGPGGGRSGAVRPEGPPAGGGAARAGERLRLRPPAPGAGAPRPAGGRQGAPPRAAPPPPWRRVGRGGGVRPAVPALVQPTDLVLLRPDAERLRGPL